MSHTTTFVVSCHGGIAGKRVGDLELLSASACNVHPLIGWRPFKKEDDIQAVPSEMMPNEVKCGSGEGGTPSATAVAVGIGISASARPVLEVDDMWEPP